MTFSIVRSNANLIAFVIALTTFPLFGEERREQFDSDPGWEGYHNRSETPAKREVTQDFGFSQTKHCQSGQGEIGGFMTPAGEPAYYAKEINEASFDSPLKVSGKLACEGREFHTLIGFFHSDSVKEWRVPNSIFLRIYGRGDVFYAYVEYATSRWRAGADTPGGFPVTKDPETGRSHLVGFPSKGKVYEWSLEYDPEGNHGGGTIIATLGKERSICHLDEGHRGDEAKFNRFGMLAIPKHNDTGGHVFLDDLELQGETYSFETDPKWKEIGNRRKYLTEDVRPRFNFGWSKTSFSGGTRPGELGGIVFRGDNRTAEKLAYYGDRIGPVTTEKPLRSSGKISLQRAISDSTVLLGFFHSKKSIELSEKQETGIPSHFLGIAIEGPSREGFLVYPMYHFQEGKRGFHYDPAVRIQPDGKVGNWSLNYDPSGEIVVEFEKKTVKLKLTEDQRDSLTEFDRFGLVTTWIDGNSQHIYFDDLSYTVRQE